MPSTPITIDRRDPRFDTLKRGHNLRFPATESEAASRLLLCSNAAEAADMPSNARSTPAYAPPFAPAGIATKTLSPTTQMG